MFVYLSVSEYVGRSVSLSVYISICLSVSMPTTRSPEFIKGLNIGPAEAGATLWRCAVSAEKFDMVGSSVSGGGLRFFFGADFCGQLVEEVTAD